MADLLETLIDLNWYLDSGGTNHCSLDSSNFIGEQEFAAIERIYMRNGELLKILHTGNFIFLLILL